MSSLGIYLQAPDGNDFFSLGSAHAFNQFCDWIDSVPEAIGWHELTMNGESRNSVLLIKQLKDALKTHPPNKGIRTTAKYLLKDVLRVGHTDEIVQVVNEDDGDYPDINGNTGNGD